MHTWAQGPEPTRLQTTPRSLPKLVWMVQTTNQACLAEPFSATTRRRLSQRSVPSCGCTRKEVRRLHEAEGCRDETPASSRHRFGGAAFANMGTRQYCGQGEKVWLAGITGDEIREMKKRAEKTPVPQTKAMKDFLETTTQRQDEKGKLRVWRGFGTKPSLRVKSRSVDLPAPSRESRSVDGRELLFAVEERQSKCIYRHLAGHALSSAAGY